MNKAILLKSNDWEGLYVDGKLIDEGNIDEMNEGEERAVYFTKLAHNHKFELKDMKVAYLKKDDDEKTEEYGSFHNNLCDFYNTYD